jgi:alkyl hydroperoxide reductase subunit AhpF
MTWPRKFVSTTSAATEDKYDLCVIGCGPAGFAATMRARVIAYIDIAVGAVAIMRLTIESGIRL